MQTERAPPDLLAAIQVQTKPSHRYLNDTNSPKARRIGGTSSIRALRQSFICHNELRSTLGTSFSTEERVGDYEVGEVLGKGSYAVVKKAKNVLNQQICAIKIYPTEHLKEQKRKDNLTNEIQILGRLKHPTIIKLYDTIHTPEKVCLILEYFEGSSLLNYIRAKPQKRLPEPEARKLFADTMRAVEYLHSNGITHRDIKLENILIDQHSTLKLIDFGFATCGLQKARIFCGTPSYMAPEIVNKLEYFGPPADIWACGILLCLMLTGKYPYIVSKESELYEKIKVGDLSLPDMPEEPKKLLKKMFAYVPEARPTAQEILGDAWVKNAPAKLKQASFGHPPLTIRRVARSARRASVLRSQSNLRAQEH